jgi:hypothetical protein
MIPDDAFRLSSCATGVQVVEWVVRGYYLGAY